MINKATLYEELYSEGYLDCFNIDNDEKGEIKEKIGGKSTSLINAFIDEMSEGFNQLSFHEFVADFAEPLNTEIIKLGKKF
ncbi:unnamed protein product [Rhizophagus irregularis]|nr:unnamed protein product [Rhizophagus irregularis]